MQTEFSRIHNQGFILEDFGPELNQYFTLYPNFDTNGTNQYYIIAKFYSELTNIASDFSFIYINITSLVSKLDQFVALIEQFFLKFDIYNVF